MPIDIRLTAIPAAADTPLASHVATAAGGPEGGVDLVVAVQGADEAWLEPYLGVPAADVIAACGATGDAGDVAGTVVRVDGKAQRLLFLGLGDGSEADMRKAGAVLGRRAHGRRAQRCCASTCRLTSRTAAPNPDGSTTSTPAAASCSAPSHTASSAGSR